MVIAKQVAVTVVVVVVAGVAGELIGDVQPLTSTVGTKTRTQRLDLQCKRVTKRTTLKLQQKKG